MPPAPPPPQSAERPVLELDAVSVIFGDAPKKALPLLDAGADRDKARAETGQILGVHDCSLTVASGEIVVLMGLSGSGKSTLLRAINRLALPTRGRVLVDDGDALADITNASDAVLRDFRGKRIAMVFQQFALLPWRTVVDNVAFGLEMAGVSPANRRERARRQLEMVNMAEWMDCHVHELSGGMQQRVGLARALATEAPILLMDEPFSALDPLIRSRLQDELLHLQGQLRRTIVFVSHDLDEALKIGARIVIMEGGRIIQIGAPEDIVLRPATPYVAEFVAHMNPMTTLRAKTVMRPLEGGEIPDEDAPRLAKTDLLREVVRRRHKSGRVLYVEDDNGAAVGKIDVADIERALLR